MEQMGDSRGNGSASLWLIGVYNFHPDIGGNFGGGRGMIGIYHNNTFTGSDKIR
jgi:hypothetical protein